MEQHIYYIDRDTHHRCYKSQKDKFEGHVETKLTGPWWQVMWLLSMRKPFVPLSS